MEEFETEPTNVKLMDKKQNDITVRESIQAAAIVIAISALAPVAVSLGVAGTKALCKKFKEHRTFKKLQKENAKKNKETEGK